MGIFNKLHDAGQSVWLDFIRRDMLWDGKLEGLVKDGLRGLTSNPSIFQNAIAGSKLYDDAIKNSAHAEDLTTFETLAVEDIQKAADLLMPVYRASEAADGYVSLEVSPRLAHDTTGTLADARRLWMWVDRPNLMIKVPATPAGVLALEDLIAEGINVNATLLFSLKHYEAVALAYIRGAMATPHPTRIASVASFFVSRVDNKVDPQLEKVNTDGALALRGRIAVANSKLAYRRFEEIFGGSLFAKARSRGIRPQRVLWASTSTKNKDYSDLLYVDNLVGPNTVNTMPPITMEAFRDHGHINPTALTGGVDEARANIDALVGFGIDLSAITEQLQSEGVASFSDSFHDLLAAISDKRASLAGN